MALANVHRFTTDEFLAIDDLPRRVELMDGVICDMSPEGPLHALTQETVLRALMDALPSWHILGGGSVRVGERFCPIPDVAVYPPGAATTGSTFDGRELALVVEVGLTTAWSDRTTKLSGYAGGAVAEVWLVVPDTGILTCYRLPHAGRYQDVVELSWPDGLTEAVERLTARLLP